MTKAKKVYTVSPIPGRGMALIATTAIPVGKRIIGEKPVVSLTDGEKIADKAHLFTNCAMSLANSYPDHPDVVGIFYTNCIGRPGSDRISDLCVRISRANHSCRPSAMYSWNDSLQKEVLYAVRPIWEGDEITVEYNAHTDDFDADRQHLFDTWGFQCDCRMCMEATPSYKEMYNRYPSVIEDILGFMTDVKKAFKSCLEAISMHEKLEFGLYRLGTRMYELFQLYASVKDVENAKLAIECMIRIHVLQFGVNPSIQNRYKAFAADPSSHSVFGLCEAQGVVLASISQEYCDGVVANCSAA